MFVAENTFKTFEFERPSKMDDGLLSVFIVLDGDKSSVVLLKHLSELIIARLAGLRIITLDNDLSISLFSAVMSFSELTVKDLVTNKPNAFGVSFEGVNDDGFNESLDEGICGLVVGESRLKFEKA